MHNLVPNIDRRAKLIYGAFYNLDGAFNASAKPARRGQNQCFRTVTLHYQFRLQQSDKPA
jgi:hypothetical protein